MKHFIKGATAAFLLTIASTAVSAIENKIAVFDVNIAFEQSSAVKSIHEQIEAKAKASNKSSTDKEKQLKQKLQDLDGKKNALSQDAYEAKKQDMMKEVDSFNKEVYSQRMQMDKAYGDALEQVQKKILSIIEKRSKQGEFNLVIAKGTIMYNDPQFDITEGVVKELNSELSDVKVNFSVKK